MFGANQQVPRAGEVYKDAETAAPAQFLLPVGQVGETRCGLALPVFHRPLAVRVERKLTMSCIYSSSCVYGLAALAVGIWSIPLLFVLWRVVKAPKRAWIPLIPFLFLLGLVLLIQGASELIGPETIMALIYILAGVR